MIATFFSYKGGVGRSMALANVAAELTNRHGYRVLAVDWDLEAPGLHYYFGLTDKDLQSKPGLLDILIRPDLLKGDFNLAPFLTAPSPAMARRIKHGSLDLLTCGRLDPSYRRRVAGFDWKNYYEVGGADHFDRLKEKFASDYDICLIDSRAGQTDTNVPATGQLADLLVMLFTSNDQSLSGTEHLCRSLRKVYLGRPDAGELPIVLVPSRVFTEEPEYNQWIKTVATPVFNRLVEAEVLFRRHQRKGIEQFALAIDQAVSIREQLPVLDDTRGEASLVKGYRALVELLVECKRGEAVVWHARPILGQDPEPAEAGKVRETLQLALDRGDQVGVALASIRLAQLLTDAEQTSGSEAQRLAASALAILRRSKVTEWKALALHTMGRVASRAGEYRAARKYYLEALALLAEDREAPRAIVLHDLGAIQLALGEHEQAEAAFRAALELQRELKDSLGQAATLLELGNLELALDSDPTRAGKRYSAARAMFESAAAPHGVALASLQIGEVYALLGQWYHALVGFDRAARLYETLRHLSRASSARARAGDAQLRYGQPEEAIASYRLAATAAQSQGDVRSEQTVRLRLAEILFGRRKLREAREEATEARRLSENAGLPAGAIDSLLLLAEIEAAADDRAAMEQHLSDAERLAGQAKGRADLKRCRAVRARLYSR